MSNNPKDEARREYERTRDAVLRAAECGYHLPYDNIHDDEHLEQAYYEGFSEGVRLARIAEAA